MTMMHVGNEEYAKQNPSFGLTTLRNRHVRIDGGEVAFRFRGLAHTKFTRAPAQRGLYFFGFDETYVRGSAVISETAALGQFISG
jgi:DNA topoisomerase IB